MQVGTLAYRAVEYNYIVFPFGVQSLRLYNIDR